MHSTFFEEPILNSPYEEPGRHHALDEDGQPTDRPPIDGRRPSAHLENGNAGANPGLMRLAMKMATGAGKTSPTATCCAKS